MHAQRHAVMIAFAGALFAIGVGTPFVVGTASKGPVDWWPNPWIIASSILGFVGLVLLVSLSFGWPISALRPGRDEEEEAAARDDRLHKRDFLAQQQQAAIGLMWQLHEGDQDAWRAAEDLIRDMADWIERNIGTAERQIFLTGLPTQDPGNPPKSSYGRLSRASENTSQLLVVLT